MSLVRLLTSGKSLIGLKNPEHRYEMRRRYLLPRFGSQKNPFAAPETIPSCAPAPAAIESQKVERYQMTPAELAAARLKETNKLPTPPQLQQQPQPALTPLIRINPIAWIAPLRRFNPIPWWTAWRAKRKSAAVRAGKTPVQCELSLDRVKVVRNDLSDADVELVPVKATRTTAPRVDGPAVAPEKTPDLIKT